MAMWPRALCAARSLVMVACLVLSMAVAFVTARVYTCRDRLGDFAGDRVAVATVHVGLSDW